RRSVTTTAPCWRDTFPTPPTCAATTRTSSTRPRRPGRKCTLLIPAPVRKTDLARRRKHEPLAHPRRGRTDRCAPACLGWYRQLLRPPDFEVPAHWTPRDQEAWKLVEKRAREGADLSADKLGDPNFYLQTAQQMGQELAAFFHPRAADPVANLTVPEILAVI